MDRIDIKILNLLQQNGKISNQELAEKVALSPSPCLRRVKQLEDSGYIDRYAAELDPTKIGLGFSVLLSVELKSHDLSVMGNFEKCIKKIPEIIQCYMVSGQPYAYTMKVVSPSLDHYQNLLLNVLVQIPGVKNVNSGVIIKTVINDRALPLAHLEQDDND